MLLLPAHPHMIQRDYLLTSTHLCKGVSASSTTLFPASFSSSALPPFLALFFASSLYAFSLYLFPGLSKDFFAWQGCSCSPFTWRRRELRTALTVSALSQVSLQADSTSSPCRTEVLRNSVERKPEDAIAWPGAAAVSHPSPLQPRGVCAAACLCLKEVVGVT